MRKASLLPSRKEEMMERRKERKKKTILQRNVHESLLEKGRR
jgi:hypothetical protein